MIVFYLFKILFFYLYSAIWIQEEKELLQEVAGMGELREPWHTKQVELLDRHLHLLHLYSQAKENLAAFKGRTKRTIIYYQIKMN